MHPVLFFIECYLLEQHSVYGSITHMYVFLHKSAQRDHSVKCFFTWWQILKAPSKKLIMVVIKSPMSDTLKS